ncbi:hypothetical protein Kpol_1052p12, partial [Vanderwaltozyma polyspora DSM 70294]
MSVGYETDSAKTTNGSINQEYLYGGSRGASHKPRLIVLIRHGESESNKDKLVNEHTPNHLIPLTEHGWAQAKAAGINLLNILNVDDTSIVEELKEKYSVTQHNDALFEVKDYHRFNKKKDLNVVFYTSPYRRTRETLKGVLDVIDEYNEKNSGIKLMK